MWVCKALIDYRIDPEKCVGCHTCFNNCPVNAIEGEAGSPHRVITEDCIKCGMCHEVCPSNFSAVEKVTGAVEVSQ